MPYQLEASTQPAHRRLARGVYRRFLCPDLPRQQTAFSAIYNFFQPRAPWPGHDAEWDSLTDYAQWLPRHVRWRIDRLNGVIDVFPDRETIAAQFRDRGYFEDDCDGLAYFSAQNLPQFVADPDRIFIVTLILDPYTFAHNALTYAAHVICVFYHDSAWRVISNDCAVSRTVRLLCRGGAKQLVLRRPPRALGRGARPGFEAVGIR